MPTQEPASTEPAAAGAAGARTRPLLTNGNSKLGPAIGAWSLPALDTCPGATRVCARVCYALRYTRRLGIDYRPNQLALYEEDFTRKMIAEARWRRVVRIHVSGDFDGQSAVLKWQAVAIACPSTVFYAYTRSWRSPTILRRLLLAKGATKNLVILWSCDRESGVPEWMDAVNEVAWMAISDDDRPPRPVRIVFRHRQGTVMARMNASTVCPAENGIANSVTCQRCRLCFREAF